MSTSTVRALDTYPGAPHEPVAANKLLSNAGPASWANRQDVPDLTVHGDAKIRPMRVCAGFYLESRDPNPIGMAVIGADGAVAGTCTDVWVDRSEPQVRYYEVEAAGRRVLVPFACARVRGGARQITVKAITAAQFADVPATRSPDTVTLREEDRIMAYFAGGYLWATPDRAEPLL